MINLKIHTDKLPGSTSGGFFNSISLILQGMQTILLLHGALGSAGQLQPLADTLSKTYHVHTLNFSGHGGNDTHESFAIELFAEDVLQYMATHLLDNVIIFGYSMGGYVGMYLAKHHPGKVSKLITLATKFHWDAPTAAKEVKMLDPEQTILKVPVFAETLQKRHGNWTVVMQKTADMMLRLGTDNTLKTEDYPAINIPCLLLLGDRDKMISLEETVQTYKLLPNAQMGMLPNTAHPIEKLDLPLVKYMTDHFLQ